MRRSFELAIASIMVFQIAVDAPQSGARVDANALSGVRPNR